MSLCTLPAEPERDAEPLLVQVTVHLPLANTAGTSRSAYPRGPWEHDEVETWNSIPHLKDLTDIRRYTCDFFTLLY